MTKGVKNIRTEILETEGNVTTQESESDNNFTKEEYLEKYFPIVRASTLSIDDEFLKHEPKSDKQKEFKKKLIEAIESGLSDFRAQRIDPSFNDKGEIYFHVGMKPAVGKTINWWKENAEKFIPEKGSRLGTTKERNAFLGLLIKYLIEKEGYTISDAWKAVCDQSKDLGHYKDSKNSNNCPDYTGSWQVGEWNDLANTYKIIIDDEAGEFFLFGGNFHCNSEVYSLEVAVRAFNSNVKLVGSVGWIVLSV